MSQELKVTFQPSGRTVYVLPDTLLLEIAGRVCIREQDATSKTNTFEA